MSKKRFIDWGGGILSYDARLNLVIAKRNIGKTFGIREQMLRDYIANGECHVAITRYENDVPVVAKDYFSQIIEKTADKKLSKQLQSYEFSTKGSSIRARMKPEDDKHQTKWEEIVRVIPLSKASRYKQASMHNLRRVVFDEALIDKSIDSYTKYLPNEYNLLQNLIQTLERYSGTDDSGETRLRVYLMGNAVDLVNPYFATLHINEQPDFGVRWFFGKLWLFVYPDPSEYTNPSHKRTLAERMSAGTDAEAGNYDNIFKSKGTGFIDKKTPDAYFTFGFCYGGEDYGVWIDERKGLYYINNKLPRVTDMPIFALSTDDNKPNLIVAKRSNVAMKILVDGYCYGLVRFENPAIREKFTCILKLFGVI